MKKITFILTLLIAFTASAQNSSKSKALLDEVSSKVKSYKNIVIDFTYLLENTAENIQQETRGDVSLKGQKYRLNLMGTTRLFDGKKIYTIIPEDEEVNISTYDPSEKNGITPSEMLTFYEEGYTFKWDMKKDVKGRKIQYIKLTPIDSDVEIKEILLGIDEQTKHIYNLVQTQSNGTKITIKVNSFKTDQPLSANLFNFNEDKFQGYYINRLD